jgi:hypothetical protein
MQFTMKTIAAVAVLLSAAAAAPAPNTSPNVARDLIVLPGSTDQSTSEGTIKKRSYADMKKRGATDTYGM